MKNIQLNEFGNEMNKIGSILCMYRTYPSQIAPNFMVSFCVCMVHVPKLLLESNLYMEHLSRIVRKPDFCLGENKGADQLRGNREADQRLCFRYSDSTIPLLLKSEISSF